MRRRLLLPAAVVLLASSCDAPGLLSPGDARFAVSPEIAPPTNVQTERTENGRVLISFEHDGTALHRLILSRSTSAAGPWVTVLGTNKSHARLFSDGGYDVTASGVWWRVTACTQSGACSDSEPVSRGDLSLARIVAGPRLVSGDPVTLVWNNATNDSVWGNVPRLRGFELVVDRVTRDGDTTIFVREIPRMEPTMVFTDSTPEPGVVYDYFLRFRNVVGSAPIGSTAAYSGRPAAPENFSVAIRVDGRAMASFAHDGTGVTHWVPQTRQPGGEWRTERDIDRVQVRSFSIPYDPAYDVLEFRVLACRRVIYYPSWDYGGRALWGCAASEAVRVEGLRIHPPTDLHVEDTSPGRVRLAWTDGSGPLVSTVVLRRDAVIRTVTQLRTLPYGTTTFVDSTAPSWRAHDYRVYSFNSQGSTDSTEWLRVPATQTEFAPPQVVTDSARPLPGGIRPYGRAARTPATGMETRAWLEWSTRADFVGALRGGAHVVHYDTLAVFSNHAFTPVGAGTYYYRLAAYNQVGDTVYAAARTFVYQAPAAPTGLTAQVVSGGDVAIGYAHPGTNVSEWRLFRRAIGTSNWLLVRRQTTVQARSMSDGTFSGDPSGQEWRVEACTFQLCTSSGAVRL